LLCQTETLTGHRVNIAPGPIRALRPGDVIY
jgi:hypothetical protein